MTAFSSIDWQAPWWRPWRELGQPVEARWFSGHSVCDALNAVAPSGSVQFVSQATLPAGQAYEAFVYETKTVPTRDNQHDFFNGLAWLRFPKTKAKLNALQFVEICRHGVGQVRGPLRDALTLFDENAAFLCCQRHAAIISALRERDWRTAFQSHRALLAADPPVLFGHALLEKLVSPYKSITAHVFPVQIAINLGASRLPTDDLQSLDAAVAAQLDQANLVPKPFVPLPILGIPGWWIANELADFYTDSTVFRSPRP